MKDMKKLALIPALFAPSLFAAPLPPAEELACNTVTAVYERMMERPCHFRTADCPDKCDHALRVAVFRVVTNEAFSRPGEYGDDKLQPGDACAVDMKNDVEGQDKAVQELVKTLRPGDAVRMTIRHYYVKTDHAHYPVRPVTAMERLSGPVQMPDKKDSPLDHEDEVMPIAR